MDETAHDRTDAAQVEPADGGAAAPEEPNPWHIRLDRRKDDFMLYWVWPEGHSEDAVIRFTHADGRQTSMPCAIDFYARDMGRAIPADKLGVGRNRVTICYDRLMRSADVMGRRVKVYYGVTAGKRSRAMQLEDDRVELYPFTLRFHAEGDSVRQSLRLALRIQGGIPIRYSLPEGVCNAEGVESVSFHATAAEAELVCTDGCADMLEIVRREPF